MRFKTLDETQALQFPGFIRPDLLDDEELSDFIFYAAEDERGLLGMAVVDPEINGPELLSIAVIPSALRTGVGSGLIDYVKRDLEKLLGSQGRAYDTYALFSLLTPQMEQKEDLIGFLKSNDFFEAERNEVYQIRIHDLLSSDLLDRARMSSQYRVMQLKAVTRGQLATFCDELDKMGRFSGYDFDSMDQDISMFVTEGERIIGCALFNRAGEKLLDNEWIYMENAAKRPQALMAMLKIIVRPQSWGRMIF